MFESKEIRSWKEMKLKELRTCNLTKNRTWHQDFSNQEHEEGDG